MIKYIYIIDDFNDKKLAGCLSVVIDTITNKIINSKFIFQSFDNMSDLKEKWKWSFLNENHILLSDFNYNEDSIIDETMINLFETSFENNFKEFKLQNTVNFNNYTYEQLNTILQNLFNRKPHLLELHFYFTFICLRYAKHFEENLSEIINLNLYEFYIKKEKLNRDDYTIEDFLYNIIEINNIINSFTNAELLSIKDEESLINLIVKNIDFEFLLNNKLSSLSKILSKNLLILNVLLNEKEIGNMDSLISSPIKDKNEVINNILDIIINNTN